MDALSNFLSLLFASDDEWEGTVGAWESGRERVWGPRV